MGHWKRCVVIPCYRVRGTVREVVLSLAGKADCIIAVDDGCPQQSGREVEALRLENVHVLYHERNRGVGAAVITGYRKALESGCEVIIKVDGDGQMDPGLLENVTEPVLSGRADYAKGNRFRDFSKLSSMPRSRLLGNSILSFIVKAASGYWNIMDPTNGFTAIHRSVLKKINLDKVTSRYFFEVDMLVNLNIVNAVVADVPIPAIYEGEESSLNVLKESFRFPPKLFSALIKRIFLKYYVYNFNMASVYLLLGLPTLIASILFGTFQWIDSIATGEERSAGTIMLAALPIIVSFQMLLQFINIDIMSVPSREDVDPRP